MHSDNLPRWHGGTEGFYEVWYLKLNLGTAGRAPALWLRFTVLSMQGGLKRVAETWAIFFDPGLNTNVNKIAIKNTAKLPPLKQPLGENDILSLGALQFSKKGDIRIEDSVFSAQSTRGSVISQGNEVHWDLSFKPNDFTFFHVPKALSKLKLSKSEVCKPNVNVRFSGEFSVNGRRYECDPSSGAPGCQGHIWGKRYAHDWAWAHCNAFDSANNAVIELLTARIKLGGVVLSPPMSAMFLQYKDETFELNSIWDALSIRSGYEATRWSFSTEKGRLRLSGEIDCTLRDLAGITYEDTTGGNLYCYNTALASMRLAVYFNGKLEETLLSRSTTSFETASRSRNPYVEVLL